MTSSSVISQLQTKVLRLSRECEEAKAQNEDAMNTLVRCLWLECYVIV